MRTQVWLLGAAAVPALSFGFSFLRPFGDPRAAALTGRAVLDGATIDSALRSVSAAHASGNIGSVVGEARGRLVLDFTQIEASIAVPGTAVLAEHPFGLWHNNLMPINISPKPGMPPGTLPLLILRVLQSEAFHGYAIAQRIHILSSEILAVEEGLLYPTLQKMLLKGWLSAKWGISETNRKVRFYELTKKGREQLKSELSGYHRFAQAIQDVLRTA